MISNYRIPPPPLPFFCLFLRPSYQTICGPQSVIYVYAKELQENMLRMRPHHTFLYILSFAMHFQLRVIGALEESIHDARDAGSYFSMLVKMQIERGTSCHGTLSDGALVPLINNCTCPKNKNLYKRSCAPVYSEAN